MIYEMLGRIVREAERFHGDETQRERIMRLNKQFSEAFFSGREGRKLSENLQMKYNSCLNAALASLMYPERHDELASRAQELYRQLPKPKNSE